MAIRPLRDLSIKIDQSKTANAFHVSLHTAHSRPKAMGIHHSTIYHVNIMSTPAHASRLSDAERFTCFTLVQDWIFETNNEYIKINQDLVNDNVELIQECEALRAQRDSANRTLETINDFAIQQTLLVSSLQVRVRRLNDQLMFERTRRVRRRLSSEYDSQETIVIETSDSESDGDML